VQRGYIGIMMSDTGIDEEAREFYKLPDTNGVIVQNVVSGGPADKAGLLKDDVIREVAGEVVKDAPDLLSKIASRRPGEKVKLGVYRNGKEIASTLTLAARPDPRDLPHRESPGAEEPQEESGEGKALGIRVENLTPSARRRAEVGADVEGVVVTEVDPASKAAEVGVEPGMIVTSLNDQPVGSVSDWNRVLRDLKAGTPVKVELALDDDRTQYVFLRVQEDKED
jgi:serine protease Do